MQHSLAVYTITNNPEGRTSLPEVEKGARIAADMICKGLAASPHQSVSAPCLVILPLWFHAFTACTREIAKRRSIEHCSILRLEYHKVLDALVTFANTSWTREQKAIFESCTCQQHKNPKVKQFEHAHYHRHCGYKEDYGPFQEVVSSVFTLLVNVIHDMVDFSSTSLSKTERNPGKRSKWPSSASKFILHDNPTMVSACITWAQLTQTSIPLQTLSLLTFCCPSLEIPIAQSKDLLPLFASLFSQFLSSMKKLNFEDVNPTYKKYIQFDIYGFVCTIDQSWFHDLISTAKTNKSTASALTSIYNTICDLVPIIHYFLVGSCMPIKRRMKTIAATIYNSISEATINSVPESRHQRLIPYTESDLSQGTDSTLLLARGFASSVIILRMQLKCAHTLCTETTESTKTNLKKCSGCQVVRYCSRACQVGDWKDHKPACRPLKVLLPFSFLYMAKKGQVSSDELTDSFTKHMSDGGLTGDDLKSITSYMVSHTGDTKSHRFHSWDGEEY